MIRRTIAAAAGLLVLFHAWLLGSQLWSGQLAEPGLILRWTIAALLVAALVGVRQSGAPVLWGRKAVSIWLLAALLHGPRMADAPGGFELPGLPEAVTFVTLIAAASLMLGLGLAVLAARAARVFGTPGPRLRFRPIQARGLRHESRVPLSAPRPPPFAS